MLSSFILISCSTTQKVNNQPKSEKELLTEATEQLNGLWKKAGKDIFVTITLSKENFTGTWFSKNYISSAPLIELKLIEEQLNLVFSDILGGDTFNIISIKNDVLIIKYTNGGKGKYHKVKQENQ